MEREGGEERRESLLCAPGSELRLLIKRREKKSAERINGIWGGKKEEEKKKRLLARTVWETAVLTPLHVRRV